MVAQTSCFIKGGQNVSYVCTNICAIKKQFLKLAEKLISNTGYTGKRTKNKLLKQRLFDIHLTG